MHHDEILNALSRRKFFGRMANGMAGMALAHLLRSDLLASNASPALRHVANLKPKAPHFAPRAKSVIQLFMHGGPSQMDLLDEEPLLKKYAGKPFPGEINVQVPEKAGGIL